MVKRGMVKWFSASKGFGFITEDGKDYFAHFKSIVGEGYKSLDAGDTVEFRAAEGKKGLEAHDIRVVYFDGNSKDAKPRDCENTICED